MTPLECRPGVLAVHVQPCGDRRAVAECACCGQRRVVKRRGLCRACEKRHERAGTIADWGWTKAERLAEYRQARAGGLSPHQAAARVGVTRRTAWRYEAALRELRAS